MENDADIRSLMQIYEADADIQKLMQICRNGCKYTENNSDIRGETDMETITSEEAFQLLKKYNKDPFHIQHALTVEAVMKWYARELGHGAEIS